MLADKVPVYPQYLILSIKTILYICACSCMQIRQFMRWKVEEQMVVPPRSSLLNAGILTCSTHAPGRNWKVAMPIPICFSIWLGHLATSWYHGSLCRPSSLLVVVTRVLCGGQNSQQSLSCKHSISFRVLIKPSRRHGILGAPAIITSGACHFLYRQSKWSHSPTFCWRRNCQ